MLKQGKSLIMGSEKRIAITGVAWAIAVSILLACSAPLLAQEQYSPEHPRVQESVQKALKYIETQTALNPGNQVLAALAIVESGKRYDAVVPSSHPVVEKAAKTIVDEIESGKLLKHDSVYYPCLSLILLCDLGGEKYRKQILALLEQIVESQEPSGAFTYKKYRGQNRGDTSQSQYVALAIWVAKKHGFQVPDSIAQRMLNWYMDVNQSNGSWYYDYLNGGPGEARRFTLSIHAASLGTVYLLADHLQLNPKSSRRKKKADANIAESAEAGIALPPSVSTYVPPKEGELVADKRQRKISVNRGKLSSVKGSANRYMADNFTPFLKSWGYYYLYAFERYAFFRERAEGSVRETPDWYDQAAVVLFDRQKEDGSFKPPQRGENPFQATAFATLFLVRSSEVLVPPSGQGGLSGGEGLRPNVRLDLAAGGGRIKSFDVVRGLEDVMELLNSEEIDQQQFELIQDSLGKAIGQLSSDGSKNQKAQIAFMRGLVTDRNYFRRLIAIRVLSRQQTLDNVPALIYALGDPDLRVCAEAHNGLRLISRKLDSIKVSDEPDYSEFQSVKRKWTDWYLKIRPGASLLD